MLQQRSHVLQLRLGATEAARSDEIGGGAKSDTKAEPFKNDITTDADKSDAASEIGISEPWKDVGEEEERVTPSESLNQEKITPVYSVSIQNMSRVADADIPEYKMLGEAFNSYILVETEGKLLMIDKHAAHERILFEDMKKNISEGADSQILMLPLEIMLSPEEADAAINYKEEIAATGFDFTVIDKGATVSAIPSGISRVGAEELFVGIVGKIASGTGSLETVRQEFYEQALYQASCKAAIKAGRIYDSAHTDWVCRQVLSRPEVRFCPHGRPVAFELSKGEIEHWFKRK